MELVRLDRLRQFALSGARSRWSQEVLNSIWSFFINFGGRLIRGKRVLISANSNYMNSRCLNLPVFGKLSLTVACFVSRQKLFCSDSVRNRWRYHLGDKLGGETLVKHHLHRALCRVLDVECPGVPLLIRRAKRNSETVSPWRNPTGHEVILIYLPNLKFYSWDRDRVT